MHTRTVAYILLFFLMTGGQAAAQHFLEVRGANTRYRYFDWNYTFANSVMLDAFYIGVPGSNEFNFGGGYAFKPKSFLTIAPLAYAVIGKEAGQRGVKIALLIMLDKNGWKANGFVGHFVRFAGDVGDYQVLDTFDVSRIIHGPFEAGLSNGFFHAEGMWNPQIGPLLKLNDRFGSTYLSMRFGPENELRFGRTFLFTK